eukprot:CAMPEP_0175138148 /NCGR_PEP_ID=MMETSP0087-20121206/10189_1 /TAXON_ID=136419 /ORGANISM="Unknown Unknown, Strain D1" /LENGTH=426 /DNA_ID=CAMNT_0016421021 /DNA_START=40 /DNA_END=1320 /DNA_ORIENTATION=-
MADKRKAEASAEGKESSAKRQLLDWNIASTDISENTINPIRAIVDQLKIPKSKDKPLIPLSIGDPTVFGNLNPPDSLNRAVQSALATNKFTGYAPSPGVPAAREAIAKKFTHQDAPLKADDIVIASGCSGAITLAIQALASTGDNILMPRPGFSLYATVAGHSGVQVKEYNLLPDKQWECDLEHMGTLVDDRTRCIVVNNPSNPTGSNYSKQHLLDILAFAQKHKIAILADEIYENMVFEGETFYSLPTLTTEVPILVCGGIAKQYLVPGWRVGWVAVHDRKNRFDKVRVALQKLSTLILGACTLVQGALPDLFEHTEESYYTGLMKQLSTQAKFISAELSKHKCLRVIQPQGAMYVMVEVLVDQFKDISSDTDFAQKLLDEEFVFVLPGKCFNAPGFFRVVTCPPIDMLQTAATRIEAFVHRHSK